MDFVALRHLLPSSWRKMLVPRWNALLTREQIFKETRFYRQFVRPGDLVFDIGANVGLKVAVFLKLGARVIGVEPNPSCADQIKSSHTDAISSGKLRVEQLAVGSEAGEITFHVSENDSTITSGSPEFITTTAGPGMTFSSSFEAKVIIADDLVRRHGKPSFIKIDVEGMDEQVLRGLTFRPRALSFEFNTKPQLWSYVQGCLGEVTRLGFTYANFSGSGTPELRLEQWVAIKGIAEQIHAWAAGRETFGDVFVR